MDNDRGAVVALVPENVTLLHPFLFEDSGIDFGKREVVHPGPFFRQKNLLERLMVVAWPRAEVKRNNQIHRPLWAEYRWVRGVECETSVDQVNLFAETFNRFVDVLEFILFSYCIHRRERREWIGPVQ